MAELAGFEAVFAAGLAGVLAEVAPVLEERARRLLLGAGARRLGRGGIKLVAAATGASADTVSKGAAELEAGIVTDRRVRARGAGRKPVEQTDQGLWPALDALVDPESRGDPMSALRWTTKSTVKLLTVVARARQHRDHRTRQHEHQLVSFPLGAPRISQSTQHLQQAGDVGHLVSGARLIGDGVRQ